MGANRLIRLGAARGAMLEHPPSAAAAPLLRRTGGASVATPPRGRFAAPSAGFFCAVASLRPFADAQASPCGARLATAQNNPGQMVPIYREPL